MFFINAREHTDVLLSCEHRLLLQMMNSYVFTFAADVENVIGLDWRQGSYILAALIVLLHHKVRCWHWFVGVVRTFVDSSGSGGLEQTVA